MWICWCIVKYPIFINKIFNKNVKPIKIEECDLEILELLELELQKCRKLKKIRLKIEKKEIIERVYVKDMYSEIKELKEIETKLEELEIKILRKRYRNEASGLGILAEQQIELKTKKREKEDKIKEYKILIDILTSEAEDLKIRVINKLNEMRKIRTKIDELEKEKALMCIGY